MHRSFVKLLFIWKAALPNGLFPPRCFPRPEKGSEEQALEIWVQVAQPYLPPSSQRAGAAQRAMSLTSAKEGADCRVRDGGRACPRSPLVLLWGGALTGCTPPGQPSVPGLFLHLRPQQSGLRLLPSPCASPGRLLPRNPSGNRYLWGPPYVCSCTLGGGGQLRPRTPPLSLSIGA